MEEFSKILPKLWSKDIAYNQDWDISNTAKNQCAPTSLLARKIFGGKIAKYEIFLSKKESELTIQILLRAEILILQSHSLQEMKN